MEELYQIFLKCSGVICTDTRNIERGALFVALKGDNFDGNKYVQKALDEGCLFALSSDERFINHPQVHYANDTLNALQKLANFHRKQFKIPILAITGSNGKTTTKELIAAVLSKKFNLLYTQGNFNNHIGVPLTLLKLRGEHELGIIEMGANKPGDIMELADIAEPTHSLITNIGKAHIEGFGSLDGVIKTKAELFDKAVKSKGHLFINLNERFLKEQAAGYEKVTYYGEGTMYNYSELNYDDLLELTIDGRKIKTNLFGRYNANNVLTAYVVGQYFKVPILEIIAAIESYQPNNNRSQTVVTKKGNRLILDAYNANPTSLNLAIDELVERDTNKAFIIGEMLELGSISDTEHQALVNKLKETNSMVFVVGESFSNCLLEGVRHFESVESLINEEVLTELKDLTILIKGSRGVHLEEVVQYL